MKKTALALGFALGFALLSLTLHAQEPLSQTAQPARSAPTRFGPDWELSAWPALLLPVASENDSNALDFGGGFAVTARPLGANYLTLGLEGTYTYGLLRDSLGNDLGTSLSEAGLGLTAAAERPLGDLFAARAFLRGGLVMGRLNAGDPATSWYGRAETGVGLDFKPSPDWRLFADAAWDEHFGLYGALSFRAGSRWLLQSAAAKNAPRLRFGDFETGNVFPVLYSWYDDHGFGTVTLTNQGRETLKNLRAELSLKPHADGAKDCLTLASLKPGETITVELRSLLNPEVLNLTETSKASLELTVSYDDSKGRHEESRSGTIQFMDRNAITWDDDRKAAAFVSGKDPWVMDLSNNLNSLVKDLRVPGINKNIETALAVHQGLQAWGISYVHSPQSPFSRSFSNPEVIDYLKFPRQTLNYRAGDCADLSVLYASCFESLGIGTAFITVPGHIFMAIDLEMDPSAAASLSMAGDLIIRDGKTWLPLETTLRDGTLAEIVHEAAMEWQTESAKGDAAFYDIHEAWQLFPPVGLSDDGTRPGKLEFASRMQTSYSGELKPLAERELRFQLGDLDAQIKGDPKNPKLFNSRGVIMARFGRYDDASKDFSRAAALDSVPAMVNMGNLSFLKKQYADAKEWYTKAKSLAPESPGVAAAFARLEKTAAGSAAVASAAGTAQRGASMDETSLDWLE